MRDYFGFCPFLLMQVGDTSSDTVEYIHYKEKLRVRVAALCLYP